jgi:uncharacterized protein YndB with AHSA1/START domain
VRDRLPPRRCLEDRAPRPRPRDPGVLRRIPREIVRPERFVWTFGFEGMPGEPGPETYVFEEHDGKTTLTSTAEFETIEQRDAVLETGMEEGAAETWDRLDEYLEVLARPMAH